MLNIDRVWQRASQRPEFRGKKITDFGLQAIVLRQNGITPGQVIPNIQRNFPNGGILVGMTGMATLATQDGTLPDNGLDLFALSIEYQQQRSIVGTSNAIAESVFGRNNDQFPAMELYIPTNGMLLFTLESLIITNNISVTIVSHCLVPVNVG